MTGKRQRKGAGFLLPTALSVLLFSLLYLTNELFELRLPLLQFYGLKAFMLTSYFLLSNLPEDVDLFAFIKNFDKRINYSNLIQKLSNDELKGLRDLICSNSLSLEYLEIDVSPTQAIVVFDSSSSNKGCKTNSIGLDANFVLEHSAAANSSATRTAGSFVSRGGSSFNHTIVNSTPTLIAQTSSRTMASTSPRASF